MNIEHGFWLLGSTIDAIFIMAVILKMFQWIAARMTATVALSIIATVVAAAIFFLGACL